MFKKMFGARSEPHINGLYYYMTPHLTTLHSRHSCHSADREFVEICIQCDVMGMVQ